MTATEVAVPTATFTVFAGRKNGLADYSNREAALHGQVVVPVGTDLEEIEAQIDAMFTFLETKVASRLGLTWSVDEDGKVVVLEDIAANQAPAPKKAAKRAPAKAASNGDGELSTEDLWKLLQAEIDEGQITSFWDNRETKKGKQPDFKHKDSGKGLWLGGKPGAPSWFSTDGSSI